jgi:hypothetical protein
LIAFADLADGYYETMRLTLKTIDDELRRLGHDVHLQKGAGYFYFWKGAANHWLDRTVNVPKVSSLTLEQWIGEFNRLKKLNAEMLSSKAPKKKTTTPKSTGAKP